MNAIVPKQEVSAIESVLIQGDLSKFTPEQRVQYYLSVCRSLGLNHLTKPFDYINLKGKLVLYAKKDATDQLRKINSVSIDDVDVDETDKQFIVKVKGHDSGGRADVDVGVVNKSDMSGDLANALMKAVTKAKRRMTLSLCGLGWLDETEVETIPDAAPVVVSVQTGEVVATQPITMTLDEARNIKTEKGTEFGMLNPDQLQMIVDKSKDAHRVQAAGMILAQWAISEEAQDEAAREAENE